MEADKDHISLDTAKLLKGCGVESKNWFVLYKDGKKCWDLVYFDKVSPNDYNHSYSSFTWQEILWEYPEEFFWDEYWTDLWETDEILKLLQQKKYKEADLYFREHCILINK